VFIFIPRHDSIHKMSHVKKTLTALYALDKVKSCAEIRGNTRVPVAEDDGKYTTIGLKPNRGCTGIRESWPNKLGRVDKDALIKLMTRCEEVAKGYLPSKELRGLKIAQLLGEWQEINGVASHPAIFSPQKSA
jgi:hypothetical protein